MDNHLLSQCRIYFKNNRAAVSVMFALTLPLLIASFSIGIDGARFLVTRAKLSDALSQGALAVALTGNENSSDVDIAQNEKLLRSYIDYYLPHEKVKPGSLKVSLRKKYDPDDSSSMLSIDYIADAKIISSPIFKNLEQGLPGFEKEVVIASDGSNGIVRRTMDKSSVESDIVFAVDFSGSMLDPSSEPSMNRLQLLQKVIMDLSKEVVNADSSTKIGIVPFDLGVPLALPGNNELGGARIGCSLPYQLNDKYNVDYNFWSYKYLNSSYYVTAAMERTNEMLLTYYRDTLGFKTDQLINSGICNSISDHPLYSCERSGFNLASADNILKFQNDYAILSQVANVSKMSIATSTTINFKATLDQNNIFNDHYLTFEVPFGPDYAFSNVFKNMCASGFNSSPFNNYFDRYPSVISSLGQNAHVIELTSNQIKLQDFNKMVVHLGSGTDTTAGLLTAAKVIKNGSNPQKIIIMVTDGEDSGDLVTVSNRFHTQFKICQKIVNGLESLSSDTKNVKIYYISLSAKDNNEKRLAFWRDNCVGSDGAFTATDYNTIKGVISSILQKSDINFINK